MEHIVSRTLSVGQEHELLQKLESAGLNAEDAQRIIDTAGNEEARAIVAQMRINHMQPTMSFILPVDYRAAEAIRWSLDDFAHIQDGLWPEDLPVRGTGRANVHFRLQELDAGWVFFHILRLIADQHCRLPDRAESEAVLRRATFLRPDTLEITAFIGEQQRLDDDGARRLVYLNAGRDGIRLHRYSQNNKLPRRGRILMVELPGASPSTGVERSALDRTIICDECGWRVEKNVTCSNCGKNMSCP